MLGATRDLRPWGRGLPPESLGHETAAKDAWVNGGHPTLGFLKFGTKGPFADVYRSFAGAAWADWLFMAGLAGIGVALVAGIAMRLAAAAGPGRSPAGAPVPAIVAPGTAAAAWTGCAALP